MTGPTASGLVLVTADSRTDLSCWLDSARHKYSEGLPLPRSGETGGLRLSIVAHADSDLSETIAGVERHLRGEAALPVGTRLTKQVGAAPELAFMFPGQGSQTPRMLAGLAACFAPFQQALDDLSELARPTFGCSLQDIVAARADESLLMNDTYWAQASLGLSCAALARAFERINVRPKLTVGHSYGELVALWCAGVLDDLALLQLTAKRGQLMRDAARFAPGGMLAIRADEVRSSELIAGAARDVEIANLNGPEQTVVSGSDSALRLLAAACERAGVGTTRLRTSCAFHSSAMRSALAPFRAAIEELVPAQRWLTPRPTTVLSNLSAMAYPACRGEGPRLLSEQLVSRVRWRECCAALAEHGVALAVEVGPGQVLTRTLRANLPAPGCQTLAADPGHGEARTHLLELLAELHQHGLNLKLEGSTQGLLFQTETRTSPLRLVHSASETAAHHAAQEPAASNNERASQTRRSAPRGARDRKSAVEKSTHSEQQSIPIFLQDNNEVVRSYLALSSRVLDVVQEGERGALRPELFTRFIELNSDVTARYLELQQDAIDWLREQGGAGLAVQESVSRSALAASAPLRRAQRPGAGPESGRMATAPRPAAKQQTAVDQETGALVWLVHQLSEITGFPAAALAEDALLDDLGIDSLAQAALLERIGKYAPEARAKARELGAAKTIGALARVLSSATGASVDAPSDSWRSWLEDALSKLTGFPVSALRQDMELGQLGIDSLAFASLLESAARRNCRVKEHARQLHSANTVGELCAVLARSDADERASSKPAEERSHEPAATTELLCKVLAGELGRQLGSPDDPLADAGITLGMIEACLSRLAGEHALVALAGAQLHTCSTVAEMAATLAELAERRPVVDEVARSVLRTREVAVPAFTLPASVLLVGSNTTELAELRAGLLAAGSQVRTLLCVERGFLTEDGRELAREQSETLVPLLAQAGDERGLGVLFLASARGDISPQAIELNVVALLSLAKAIERVAQKTRLAVVCDDAAGASAIGARGVARALAQEWRHTRRSVTAVRLDDQPLSAGLFPACFAEEASTDWVLASTGLAREYLALRELPPDSTRVPRLSLGSEDVLVIVGGASGIAAEMACSLAERFGCSVAAIGRTPYDGTLAQAATTDAEQKRQRAIQVTAERLQRANARFVYVQADARDGAALSEAFRTVKARLGRVDLVIHGAGVIEDALVESKSIASFRRVVHTKALSAQHLRLALTDCSPKVVVLLSSLVAHTGNAGQTDYCAANEILNSLAERWNAEVDYRVVSTLWSVWTEVGLAGNSVRRLFERERMQGIDTSSGVERATREILARSQEPWVMFASPRTAAFARGTACLLGGKS